MLGPGPDQIMRWLKAHQNAETVGKEEANGAPCWSIRIGGQDGQQPGSTMCFDVESGYLTRLTGVSKTQMGTVPIDLTMSHYQDDGGIKSPHHLETRVSGQSLNIDITEVVLNGPISEDTFELPADIQALAAKKTTSAEKQEGPPPERPTLRRSR